MTLLRNLSLVIFAVSVFAAAGCCGPMQCGFPGAACARGAGGPLIFGAGCGDCDQCSGCGELYIDPWINERPDCCDPCDRCGEFNGQSCGKCRSVFAGVESLWGYRRGDCDTACGGCNSCASSSYQAGHPTYAVEHFQNIPVVEPGVAGKPYQPSRTRQIFRPKDDDMAKRIPNARSY